MAYGKFPGFIRIQYETAKSIHSQDLCTRAPEVDIDGSIFYLAWDGISSLSLDGMVQDLVDAMIPSFPTTTTFLDATAYRVLEEGSDAAVPVGFYVITAGAGTSVAGGIDAAQATWSFMDTEGKQSRIVGLDIAPTPDWHPRRPGGFVTADTTLETEYTRVNAAWSSRAGNRPASLRQVAFTLNDALRRAYHLN